MKKIITWEYHSYEYLENENRFVSSADEQQEEVYEEGDEQILDLNDIPHLVKTPFGMFQVDDAMNPYKQFKFWMGHTNFDITQTVADIIEKTPGVEVIHIFTRYRFIIAIAPSFNSGLVKHDIQQRLCGDSYANNSSIIEEKVLELKETLKGYPKWCLYVFPNGQYDYTYLKSDHSNVDEYESKETLLKEAQTISHGKLYSHES